MKHSPKMRLGMKLGLGAATLGAALGAAGIAGATTGSSNGSTQHTHAAHQRGHRAELVTAIAESGTLPAKFSCTKASAVQAKLTEAEGKIDAHLSSAAAKQQSATSAGETVKAQVITDRIASMTKLRVDLVTVSDLITATCG
jgi:hypothetical protein